MRNLNRYVEDHRNNVLMDIIHIPSDSFDTSKPFDKKQDVNCDTEKTLLEIFGFGDGKSRVSHWVIDAQLTSRFPSNFILSTILFVTHINQNEWQNQMFANPTTQHPSSIDIFMRAKVYDQIILHGLRKIENGLLVQNIKCGWILSGGDIKLISMISSIDEDKQLIKFWEIEEVFIPRQLTKDEANCENHFLQHTSRSQDETYSVKIQS